MRRGKRKSCNSGAEYASGWSRDGEVTGEVFGEWREIFCSRLPDLNE
jgi:hypothetical protein